ncbi:hypothetical protein EII34_02710 [Arachnia propionica]|uniref:Uncharacterized protein n=1 Tax=Arachnia propionica TaxID=1750 RepID=A0A3P1TAU1_9ACTN|nr:hypothetical protein EII34_02710 [Arachnia propionica]
MERHDDLGSGARGDRGAAAGGQWIHPEAGARGGPEGATRQGRPGRTSQTGRRCLVLDDARYRDPDGHAPGPAAGQEGRPGGRGHRRDRGDPQEAWDRLSPLTAGPR